MASKKRTAQASFIESVFDVFSKFGRVEPVIKAVMYWVIVIFGSLIHDFHRPFDTYFSNKRNVFNVVFVKFALAWTLFTLAPFVILSSLLKSGGKLSVVARNSFRLLVAVVVWYCVTALFDCVHDLTGYCEGSDLFSTRNSCQIEGLLWKGFDISGHSFLLPYCSLILSEELQVLNFWNDEKFSLEWRRRFRFARPLANMSCVCCCLLLLLWEVMLVFTAVYFHTVETKVLGVMFGLASWAVTYKFCFQRGYFGLGVLTKL